MICSSIYLVSLFVAIAGSTPIDDVIRDQLSIDSGDRSFVVVNIEQAVNRFQLWQKYMPRIRPFYPMRTNANRFLTELYAAIGTGFAVNSKFEIEQLLAQMVIFSDIIYSNPQKLNGHLKYVHERGVRLTEFDSIGELDKISQLSPDCQLLVRLNVNGDSNLRVSQSGHKLTEGAPLSRLPHLLRHAKRLNLTIVGAKFDIGQNVSDPFAFNLPLMVARKAFDIIEHFDYRSSILNIGGGFVGDTSLDNELVAQSFEITHDLIRLFPSSDERFSQLSIYAEPGEFLTASTFDLVTRVIGRKAVSTDEDWIYINDGVLQSFSAKLVSFYYSVRILKYMTTFDHFSSFSNPSTTLNLSVAPKSMEELTTQVYLVKVVKAMISLLKMSTCRQ